MYTPQVTPELERFEDMLLKVLTRQNGIREACIPCPGPGAARKLRRRFYSLWERVGAELEKQTKEKLRFRLQGADVILEFKPEWEASFSVPVKTKEEILNAPSD